MPSSHIRAYLLGFLVPLGLCFTLAAAAVHGPGAGAWGHVTRVLDSFAVHFLIGAVVIALLVAVLRAVWTSSALIGLVLLVAVPMAWSHIALTQPLATDLQPNLRILWFNVLAENQVQTAEISERLLAEDPDVIILAEPKPFRMRPNPLEASHPYTLGCTQLCELFILSKVPFAEPLLTELGPLFEDRLAKVELTLNGSVPFSLSVAHMSKPWYIGLTEREDHRLDEHISAQTGPHILIGDFNAAPWSHRIKRRISQSTLRGVRTPIGTWPVTLGRFGIPIDQVFVANGAQVVSAVPWGHDLGSNHLGLLVDLHIPKADAQ